MSDFDSFNSSFESGWGVQQGVNITQEDINTAQEWVQKSAQMAAQRQHSRTVNGWIAQFLSFLFKSVYVNDALTKSLYECFFIKKSVQSGIKEHNKSINNELLVGLFVPFYPQKTKELWLIKIFDSTYDFYSPLSLEKYLHSVKWMMHHFRGYEQINQVAFVQLLAYILYHYQQARWPALPTSKEALGNLIQQSIYR